MSACSFQTERLVPLGVHGAQPPSVPGAVTAKQEMAASHIETGLADPLGPSLKTPLVVELGTHSVFPNSLKFSVCETVSLQVQTSAPRSSRCQKPRRSAGWRVARACPH